MAMGRVGRTRGEMRNHDAYVAGGLPTTEAAGVISRVLLDAVSGGQPLLLTRRGRPAAVLVDADSWAELEQLASDALVAPIAS
jgi:prevent-host-death family protein